MWQRKRLLAITILTVGSVVGGILAYPLLARDEKPAATGAVDDTGPIEAVRKTAKAFQQAFDSGDARAVAGFWTKTGEYIGEDGEVVRGREAIEKLYLDFFKKHPRAKMDIQVVSVRLLGKHTALEEGTLRVQLPGEKDPPGMHYSVLHAQEDGAWKMASVREWLPNPGELDSLKDLEWLLGSWSARGPEGELNITYAWDEDRAFLRGRYTMKRKGKVAASGTQILGKNPAGGLRSWLFDSKGTVGESYWARDDNRWLIEGSALLPDGSEETAVTVLVPINKDAFTWQMTEHAVAGTSLPGTPPIKVTRVKGE